MCGEHVMLSGLYGVHHLHGMCGVHSVCAVHGVHGMHSGAWSPCHSVDVVHGW